MIYSVPYVLLILFLFLCCYSANYFRKKDEAEIGQRIEIVGVIVSFIFFAFRGYIWTDVMTYYPEFQNCSWSDFTNFDPTQFREPLFLLLEVSCKVFFNSYSVLVFFIAAIDFWLLFHFLRRYSFDVLLGFAIFLSFSGMEIMINLQRNSIAIFIFLNAIQYIEERKPWKYTGMCMLALGFHFTAIFYFPMYFLLKLRTNRWTYIAIFLFGQAVFLLKISIFSNILGMIGIGGDFVQNKIDAYSEASGTMGIGLGFFERLLTAGLVFCYYNKLQEIRKANLIFINALLVYFLCIALFSDLTEVSKRLAFLFIFSYWVIWGDLIKCFYYENNRKLFIAFLTCYCIVKTVTTINQPVQQYENFLFGKTMSFDDREYIFEKTFEAAEY